MASPVFARGSRGNIKIQPGMSDAASSFAIPAYLSPSVLFAACSNHFCGKHVPSGKPDCRPGICCHLPWFCNGTLVRSEGKLLSGSVTSGICTRFQSITNIQLLQFFIQKVWSLCRRVAIIPACPSLLDETPVPSGGLCVRCLPVPSVTE